MQSPSSRRTAAVATPHLHAQLHTAPQSSSQRELIEAVRRLSGSMQPQVVGHVAAVSFRAAQAVLLARSSAAGDDGDGDDDGSDAEGDAAVLADDEDSLERLVAELLQSTPAANFASGTSTKSDLAGGLRTFSSHSVLDRQTAAHQAHHGSVERLAGDGSSISAARRTASAGKSAHHHAGSLTASAGFVASDRTLPTSGQWKSASSARKLTPLPSAVAQAVVRACVAAALGAAVELASGRLPSGAVAASDGDGDEDDDASAAVAGEAAGGFHAPTRRQRPAARASRPLRMAPLTLERLASDAVLADALRQHVVRAAAQAGQRALAAVRLIERQQAHAAKAARAAAQLPSPAATALGYYYGGGAAASGPAVGARPALDVVLARHGAASSTAHGDSDLAVGDSGHSLAPGLDGISFAAFVRWQLVLIFAACCMCCCSRRAGLLPVSANARQGKSAAHQSAQPSGYSTRSRAGHSSRSDRPSAATGAVFAVNNALHVARSESRIAHAPQAIGTPAL